MFTSNCQLAWSSYTRLGGRSWRLDLRPSSARPPYSIGTCNIHTTSTCSRKSSEIPLESNKHCFQSSSGDLVGIKSKCCGEGRSAYWICGGDRHFLFKADRVLFLSIWCSVIEAWRILGVLAGALWHHNTANVIYGTLCLYSEYFLRKPNAKSFQYLVVNNVCFLGNDIVFESVAWSRQSRGVIR